MHRLKTLVGILRDAGFGYMTVAFAVLFIGCSVAVWLGDPASLTLGDGLWFSFETVSTIGFGDIAAAGPVARVITVILSVVSIFYLAMLTGVAVSYCTFMVKARQKETLARFMGDLERLDDMTPEELRDLSARVRRYRRRSS